MRPLPADSARCQAAAVRLKPAPDQLSVGWKTRHTAARPDLELQSLQGRQLVALVCWQLKLGHLTCCPADKTIFVARCEPNVCSGFLENLEVLCCVVLLGTVC